MGLVVDCVDVAWGAACPAREFGRRLGRDRQGEIKAVFVTHNETATGVTSDVAAVRRELDAAFTMRSCSSMACRPSGRSRSRWTPGASIWP
jgi:aspartate aminotransferase-like enzyme